MVSVAAQLCGICIDRLWNFLLHRWRDCQDVLKGPTDCAADLRQRGINVKTATRLLATADEVDRRKSPVRSVMSGSTSSGPGPNCEIDAMGQRTKSLRDSPLRGGRAGRPQPAERRAIASRRGHRDQQALLLQRSTLDQAHQVDLRPVSDAAMARLE